MSKENPLLEKISLTELQKLKVDLLFVEKPMSSSKVIYKRYDAKSTFYNANNIRTGGFYKHVSTLISENAIIKTNESR
ncbi:MAG: hypothetical protein WD512_10285 [Candidatus Paceibacterota bacterium]